MLGLYICIAWLAEFGEMGLDFSESSVPAFGDDVGGQVGNILFNYAYIVTIPSWVNEKDPSVSIHRSIWSSLSLGILSFVLIGWFGAAAFQGDQSDLLAALSSPKTGTAARVATYLFPPMALVSGIPIFSIIIRYNLMENKICSKVVANFWAVLFPWICALVMYAGDLLNDLITWGSLLTTVPLNFMLPCYLFYLAHHWSKKGVR